MISNNKIYSECADTYGFKRHGPASVEMLAKMIGALSRQLRGHGAADEFTTAVADLIIVGNQLAAYCDKPDLQVALDRKHRVIRATLEFEKNRRANSAAETALSGMTRQDVDDALERLRLRNSGNLQKDLKTLIDHCVKRADTSKPRRPKKSKPRNTPR